MKDTIKNGSKKAWKFFNSWTGTIIFVLLITMFVAQNFVIPSGSMKDSLLIGDRLFAKKFAYGVPTPTIPFLEIPLIPNTDGHIVNGDTPKRGDIVIFKYPKNIKTHYVKRCVALPGDELFLSDKDLYLHLSEGDEYMRLQYKQDDMITFENKLWAKNPYIDVHPGIHHDDKVQNDGTYPTQVFNSSIIKVAENEYFMMGDNRDHSNDSRFWGAVPYGLLEGTPWFIYFSMTDDWEIRWDRVFKTPTDLEEKKYLDKARAERGDVPLK
jgi:signal peptidase I